MIQQPKESVMGMLQPATNKYSFAKVGLYGVAGSGKTFTAALIAIGLYKFAKCTKPVGMFDTEPAASFIIPLFEKAGVPFLVYDKSRALKDLMAFMKEAEAECSIVIVDSITHVWRDTQESYLAKVNEGIKRKGGRAITKLEFHHWGPIKSAWADFTNLFLSSKLHVIVCGRAGMIYEYQTNDETGKKELITTGTRMATEKELGHEPSLLMEMEAVRERDLIVNHALVLKDRSDTINGKDIASPTFEALMGHFGRLALGGEGFAAMGERDSKEMFTEDGNDGWTQEVRAREIACEEIKEEIQRYYPGATANEKLFRAQWLERTFGTRSWSAVESKRSDALKEGLVKLRGELATELTKTEVEKEALSRAAPNGEK